MVIERKTGIILSFESDGKSEMEHALKRLSNSIDAVLLKELVLLQASVKMIGEMKEFMRRNDVDKPIIVDSRLEESELTSIVWLSNLLKNEGAYAMTIMATYGEDFIRSSRKEAKLGIFAIVDVGLQSFRNLFDDTSVIQNSVFAKNNECEGIIMTSRHLDRIKKVRETVGKDFLLLSTLEEGSKLRDSLSAGADFEIIPYRFFKQGKIVTKF